MAAAADVERMMVEAIAHHEAGRFAQADAAYRAILAHDARNVDALHFLGFLAFQRGEHGRAAELIARALALHPANARAQQNLGNAYQALGRTPDAAACFEKARALAPELVEAHYNLGIAYRDLGQRDEAAAAFRDALRLDPGLAAAHYCLGHLHCDEDRLPEAKACFREALRLRSDHAEARWSLAMAELPQVPALGDDPAATRAAFDAALTDLEDWFDTARPARGFDAVAAVQPFSLAYREEPNRELLERHGRLCSRLMEQWRLSEKLPPPRSATRPRPKPLRVGIVSAHFHSHSVWLAIVRGWFRHLDAGRFELYGYHIGTGQDAETAYAASRAARFEQGTRDLRGWVDAIAHDAPDVLIYPEVGMNPVALRLAAQRLAPVQAAAWGHPETTGLPTMDYYLSAEDLEPSGAQANYSERLVTLPHLGCSFEPRSAAGADLDLRQYGLQGETLLVCPGTAFKYAPQHDWIFPAIAAQLGRCRFLFFCDSPRLNERLRAAFAKRGLDAGRFLAFLPWLPNPAFQSVMRRAHVYLDTIGFSGFNTALQALQCGLPLVTREGRFMRGRLASGILKRIGVPELVVPSEDAYIQLAARLALDTQYRAQVADRIERAVPALYADRAPIEGFVRFLSDV